MSNQNIWAPRGRERHKQERRAQTTAFFLNPKVGDAILDIGCAEGFVTNNLAQAILILIKRGSPTLVVFIAAS